MRSQTYILYVYIERVIFSIHLIQSLLFPIRSIDTPGYRPWYNSAISSSSRFRLACRLAAAESWEFYKKLDRTRDPARIQKAAIVIRRIGFRHRRKRRGINRGEEGRGSRGWKGGALCTVRSLFVRVGQEEVTTASSRHGADELSGEHLAHVLEGESKCQGIPYHNYFRLRQTVRLLELNAAQSRHRTR